MGPYLVVYRTPERKLVYRILKNTLNDVGYINNYGWVIISIQSYNEQIHKFEETIPFYSRRKSSLTQKKKQSKLKKIIRILREK